MVMFLYNKTFSDGIFDTCEKNFYAIPLVHIFEAKNFEFSFEKL